MNIKIQLIKIINKIFLRKKVVKNVCLIIIKKNSKEINKQTKNFLWKNEKEN